MTHFQSICLTGEHPVKEVVKIFRLSLGQEAPNLEQCFYTVALRGTLVMNCKMVDFKNLLKKYGHIFWRKSPLAQRILLLQKRFVRAITLSRL